ncbi:MAG TPA: hypothetical protein VFZ68_14215 [Acidimicrobiales bacterium]
MPDTEDRIAKLESQIKELEAKHTELYKQLADARLDQWKGRLEDLEVQARLGAMETNDRIKALIQQARDRWNDATAQVRGAASTAGDVLETVRGGIERALDDLRQAMLDARSKAKT